MQNSKRIILMCGDSHCPTLTIDKDQVLIKDDFGGKVRLTKEQFDVFKNKVKNNEV